jgi:hypothetical protein
VVVELVLKELVLWSSSEQMDDRIQRLVVSSQSAVKESREKEPIDLNDDEVY